MDARFDSVIHLPFYERVEEISILTAINGGVSLGVQPKRSDMLWIGHVGSNPTSLTIMVVFV